MTRVRNIIIAVLVAILIGVLIFITLFTGKIPENPKGTVGNLPGNINNGGLFCEHNGTIYFSNPYDGGSIYAMNTDLSDPHLINTASASQINAAGDYLYYFQNGSGAGRGSGGLGYVRGVRGYFRCDLKGKHATNLIGDDLDRAILVDSSIYLSHYDKSTNWTLVKIGLEKEEPILIMPEYVNPAGAYNSTIYFTKEFGDHNIYALDTASDSTRTVHVFQKGSNFWFPVPDGNYIYCMNAGDNYKLCRISMSGGEVETLTQDRVDTFNIKDGKIYYAKSAPGDPALVRMNADGSGQEIVHNGAVSDINMAGGYVFYHEFKRDTPVYYQSINGAVAPSVLNAMPTK